MTYYNGKIYVRNSDGTRGSEVKMGMPDLNYTNPLHTFSSSNNSYTATGECYVVGNTIVSSSGVVCTINSTAILSAASNTRVEVPLLKLNAGDTIEFNRLGTSTTSINVFGLA